MSTFCATLWEEDGKAFQYTVRIEPMKWIDNPNPMSDAEVIASAAEQRRMQREEGWKWICDKCGAPFPIREKTDDTPERPILLNEGRIGRAVRDDVCADRPLAQEPGMEAVAPDRPAPPLEARCRSCGDVLHKSNPTTLCVKCQYGQPEVASDRPAATLVEKVAGAIDPDDWQDFIPEARAAITVILRDMQQNMRFAGYDVNIHLRRYARENGIDLK